MHEWLTTVPGMSSLGRNTDIPCMPCFLTDRGSSCRLVLYLRYDTYCLHACWNTTNTHSIVRKQHSTQESFPSKSGRPTPPPLLNSVGSLPEKSFRLGFAFSPFPIVRGFGTATTLHPLSTPTPLQHGFWIHRRGVQGEASPHREVYWYCESLFELAVGELS